jgi:hypothetical protein
LQRSELTDVTAKVVIDKVSLAKIESASFAEHIADSHGLKFEIKRSQMPHSDFDKERPSAWERFLDRSFP